MKISIITVCYNSAATIRNTIDSIASQQYSDREHIVVDGASQDGTMEIIKNASSVAQYVSEADKGIYDAMNKGIKMSTGEIVGILNSDDYYADDTVLGQVAEVFKNPEIQACYADLVYVDQQDTSRVVRYWRSRDFEPGLFKSGWMPAHPTFFVRRKVYEQYGDFDLSYPRQADFELTMRLLEVHKIRAVYVPRIWVKMRVGGASNNSFIGVLKGNLEAYSACKKHDLGVDCFFIPRKIFSRVPQYFRRPK